MSLKIETRRNVRNTSNESRDIKTFLTTNNDPNKMKYYVTQAHWDSERFTRLVQATFENNVYLIRIEDIKRLRPEIKVTGLGRRAKSNILLKELQAVYGKTIVENEWYNKFGVVVTPLRIVDETPQLPNETEEEAKQRNANGVVLAYKLIPLRYYDNSSAKRGVNENALRNLRNVGTKLTSNSLSTSTDTGVEINEVSDATINEVAKSISYDFDLSDLA